MEDFIEDLIRTRQQGKKASYFLFGAPDTKRTPIVLEYARRTGGVLYRDDLSNYHGESVLLHEFTGSERITKTFAELRRLTDPVEWYAMKRTNQRVSPTHYEPSYYESESTNWITFADDMHEKAKKRYPYLDIIMPMRVTVFVVSPVIPEALVMAAPVEARKALLDEIYSKYKVFYFGDESIERVEPNSELIN